MRPTVSFPQQLGTTGGSVGCLANNSDLRSAVAMTVAYADIFDFALTRSEIHRDLVGIAAGTAETGAAIDALVADGTLWADSGLVVLPGRDDLVARRADLQESARRLWPIARRVGRVVGSLPFVRLVAITGSLAAENPGPGADLDYLIVTAPGHLWTVRAMTVALVHLGRRVGIALCPNYLLTTNALCLDHQDLFTAHELLQAVPIVGRATFDRFRALNPWARSWLPNRWDASECPGFDRAFLTPFQGLGEKVLEGTLGKRLEGWERDRKTRRLASSDGRGRFTADVCEGHYGRSGRRARRAFAERCARLGIPIDVRGFPVLESRRADGNAPWIERAREGA